MNEANVVPALQTATGPTGAQAEVSISRSSSSF